MTGYITSENGTEYVWWYEYDGDWTNVEGEDAVVVLIGDPPDLAPTAEVVDALGGLTLASLSISDHGNVNVSPKDEAYLKSLARQMADGADKEETR